jgi:hypothetical protein
MKLYDNVEVSGIERIVFDRTTVYELVDKDEDFVGLWQRKTTPRSTDTCWHIDHQQMAKNVYRICHTGGYRVWVHGDTINIYSSKFEREQSAEVSEGDCSSGCCGHHVTGCIRHTD